MKRTGHVALALLLLGGFAFALAVVVAFSERWVAVALLACTWIVFSVAGTVLLRRAEPDELARRRAVSDRYLDALSRGFGRMSGGWDPRRRDD